MLTHQLMRLQVLCRAYSLRCETQVFRRRFGVCQDWGVYCRGI